MRDLRALPKAHLHLHLDAAARRSTLAELAAAKGLPMPALASYGDWEPFVEAFVDLVAILRPGDVILRLIAEAVEDAAAEGVVALELGLSPVAYAEAFGGLDGLVQAAVETAESAGSRFGVAVGFLVTANRTGTRAEAVEMAELASRWAGRGVWSFGLANDERGFPAGAFTEAFAIARQAGLIIAPHAGEFDGPSSVRACLELGASRIQHGVRSVEDATLVAELAERGVCLDVCPSSNVQLGVVASLGDHPLPTLLEAGVPCSINADDPTLFGPSILDEYELCRDELGLSDELLSQCARSSVEASGAPAAAKQRALAGIDGWLASAPVSSSSASR